MKKNRGFTLYELIVGFTILFVIVGITFCMFKGCASNEASAEEDAIKYGNKLGLNVKGASCTNKDTDGDGYVSCTISHVENGHIVTLPIECVVKFSLNSGCRAQKIGGRRGFW